MTIFATLTPIDIASGTRVTVRVCGAADEASTGVAGERWWPALLTMPVIQARFFDGDFSSAVAPASAQMDLRLDVLVAGGAFPGVERYDWAGASCTLQRLSGGSLVDLQLMQVESFASKDMVLALRLAAAGDLFDAEVLQARYAGTTGAEGGADLKGQLKPWVFGRALNVEPVFIDQIDNVFQVSGYGAVQAISAVYERGASFGASVGDFANYAALVAATIPAGRWGTCLAQGMFRLGAPPAGVITCDVDGDNVGGFLRRTGAILSNIATRIGLVDKVNAASMAALDAAVPRNVNIVIREQISFMELAQRMLAPCNAVASVGLSGRLIASRVAFAAEQFTLDAQGREMPPVLSMERQNTSAPYKRVQMGAARSWRVHSFDEIAFSADLIDRGTYDAATVYREGNIVASADKSRWLYINPTASGGNAPPTWPTASNVYWSNLEPPLNPAAIGVESGATRNVARGTYDNGTTYIQGDEVLFSGSSYRLIVETSTGNAPPDVVRWALLANSGSGPPGADGLPGISVIVSNEAHVVATAADGTGGNYTNAGGQMRLLRGDVALTPTFSIAAATPASAWISINPTTGVYTVSDPGVDVATATLRAAWAGVNYDRTYTLAKSKAGAAGANGLNGTPGLNSATVFIYRRSASVPALPSVTTTYTFATAALASLDNEWTQFPPAGTDPLYVAVATASSSGATDTIAANEWSSPVVLAENGADGAPGAPGANGAPGLNSAAVFIYKRAAAQPSDAPANGAIYTFATGVLSGTLNGWTTSVPANNGNPLWVRQASAIGTGSTDTIDAAEWSGVQQLVADGAPGAPGAPGGNTAVVFIYARGATAPAAPTGSTTYTFSTGVLSGTLGNGWTQAIPAANGQPLWVRSAVAFGTETTDSIAAAEWSGAQQLAADGATGAPGLNSASVFLYSRSTTVPPVPSTTSTYTFATGVLTGQNNSWTQAVPSGSDPLYVITASAASTGATDTIASGEWSTPSILAQNGAPGAAGLNSAPVFIYQRAATAPAAPSANATYTFATGGLTGLDNGWSATILGTTGGNPLWVRQASASGTGATDVIAPGEWSAAQQLAIDGTPGAAGGNTAVVFLYARAATAPAAPTGSTTYTFATGVLSGTPGNGWTQAVPVANGQPLWVRTAVAFAAAATDTIAAGEWSGAQRLAEDGATGPQGPVGPTIALVADNQAFTFTDGAASPTSQTITLSALLTNISGTVSWSVTPSVTLGGTGNTRTLSVADFGANRQVTVEATLGGITDRITIVRLERNVVAPANSNRVPLSRIEGGAGWSSFLGTVASVTPIFPNEVDGRRYIVANATASAAGQIASIAGTVPFPVQPGERLSVSLNLNVFEISGPAPAFWQVLIDYFLGDTFVSSTVVFTAPGNIGGDALREGFVTVPASVTRARLVLLAQSGGAGTFQLNILNPMVTSAAPGQTVHPPFSPGPVLTGPIDAGGPLLIGQLPPSKADPGLINSNVPLGANAVVNSDFTRGKFGWRAGNGTLDSQWGVNLTGTPNWFGQRNVMWMTAPGAFAINSVRDLSPNALWEGGGLPNALQFAMPVVAGDRLAASVLGAQHRCTIQLYILIFDGAGTLISAPVVGGGTPGGAANGDPANFTHLTNFADVPSNGRWAIPMMRMLGTGESDPHIFFTEPMLAKVAAGQNVVPRYSPGRSDPNADVTATVSGPADITMQFRADLALLSPLPLTADYQLGVAGASPLTSGVSWSVAVVSGSFTGTAPSIVGSGTGQLRINSALASPEATLRITPSVAGRASPPFVVRVRRQVAAPSVAALNLVNSGTFAIAHDQPIQITLPAGVSSVALTAVADLLVNPEPPQGGTIVEGKWQRESSPGTWVDVGGVATSSPSPEVFFEEPSPGEFFYSAAPGSITCNRTDSGLTPGTIQRFRFVARISLGNVRDVRFNGNGSAVA